MISTYSDLGPMIARLSRYGSLILTLSVGLLLVGCDSVGTGAISNPISEGSADTESLFEATNDLASRMSTSGQASGQTMTLNPFGALRGQGAAATSKASSVTLTSIAQIDPPGDTTRASHLTYANGTVYAGYKALGDPFKGGIDILDASDPTNILEVNSLGSDKLDVQEVVYDGDEDALYVAGAMDPSNTTLGLRGTPALLSKVTNFSSPQTSTVGLTGRVGKSVVTAPDGDAQHDLYIATDEETLYRYNADLENEVSQTVQNVEFRSVATTSSSVFTVDRGASVYSSDVGAANSLTELKGIGSGVGDLAIGRIHARNEPVLNGDRLFLALGSEGLAVLDASSGDVLFRRSGPYYTSLTLHEDAPDVSNAPTDLVYGARPNGIIDVYRVGENGIDEGDTSSGLTEVGTFDLSALDGVNFGTSPQVNQVRGVGCNVYIANSNEGVVALEIGGIAGCGDGGDDDDGEAPDPPEDAKAISFAAYCTTEDNWSSDDVSIVDTKENDDGEVVSIAWTSDTELSTVVLKAGTSLFNYDGGFSGGAASGAGDSAGSDQSPSSPCPSGEDLIFKDESVN